MERGADLGEAEIELRARAFEVFAELTVDFGGGDGIAVSLEGMEIDPGEGAGLVDGGGQGSDRAIDDVLADVHGDS